ncbi:hypothetical protein SARC_06323 [Sphaeroforma arctica JP610]|uniref:Fe2OG dioxygenase domain-containing protein n=1 Tax=Sphaeroforma arctica JP610 TaxID=667725 RepID=A0A0L0FXH8_9EUKA|nr:hypothetical protein SARC_06323 [Sphaeroforma arctica JP610]KNC81349.1 hypothetical protein SARC_06323 [Sphaeroforma arctica JP610]|eukprot:XP_014155251.1 hypothetical protein SARC_06323 [Sphaeroforma arctica JP610]
MAAKQRNNVSNKDKGKAPVKAPVVDAKSGALPSLGYLALIAADPLQIKVHLNVYFDVQNSSYDVAGPGHTIVAYQSEVFDEPLTTEVTCGDYKPVVSGCTPTKCGRFLKDNVFNATVIQTMINIIEKGMVFGGGAGGPSILDLASGAVSHGEQFISIFQAAKQNKQEIFNQKDRETFLHVKNTLKDTIEDHFGTKNLYLTAPTFFSRITDKPAKTANDIYWMPHIDRRTYGSFVYTSLVYLNDQGVDYEGGEFLFIERDDVTPGQQRTPTDSPDKYSQSIVQPRAGRMSFFTSGDENEHTVKMVTSGTRYAVTISFTCDEASAIPDPTFE